MFIITIWCIYALKLVLVAFFVHNFDKLPLYTEGEFQSKGPEVVVSFVKIQSRHIKQQITPSKRCDLSPVTSLT